VELYLHSPNASSWCGAQLKHRDNFNLPFTFINVSLTYVNKTYSFLMKNNNYYVICLQRLWVFESRIMKRIFVPKREEVAGGWRRLHNEEIHNLYASPNIIRVIKSRRMRWAM
jgi:hypothetical protein